MATRSLTEVFILMRNNAMQSRHIFSEQIMDDRMALVHHRDLEVGVTTTRDSRLPPEWVDGLEEIQYQITRIKQMMKELATVRDKHLHRPTLDDSTEEELTIDMSTQEITQMFSYCHRLVQQINNRQRGTSQQEKRISHNVVQSLVTTLQELSLSFRQSQSTYVRKLKSRDERSLQYFDTTFGNGSISEEDLLMEGGFSKEFTKDQLLFLEDNTQAVQQREREIAQIVRSIAELNEIFKDLAQMVAEQGTVIDRIDYNLEQTQSQVHEGLQQLQKAEGHQKKNRKMMCILILAFVTTVLIVVLIAVKT